MCEHCKNPMWVQPRATGRKPEDVPDGYKRRHRVGMCNSCWQREHRVRDGSRIAPRHLRGEDFVEEYTFLRSQGMKDAEIAKSMGMGTDSLRNRLTRMGIINYTVEEQTVWDWIVSYCEQGIEFTVDSLPFCDDRGLHQRVLNDAVRAGKLRRTGEKRAAALDFHGTVPRHVYAPALEAA